MGWRGGGGEGDYRAVKDKLWKQGVMSPTGNVHWAGKQVRFSMQASFLWNAAPAVAASADPPPSTPCTYGVHGVIRAECSRLNSGRQGGTAAHTYFCDKI